MYVTFDDQLKGQFVELSCGRTRARRQLGFCDGVVISENFIKPGELVAVEILETQRGWSGDLRAGFTMLQNHELLPLPSFALPPLVARGQSWIIQMGDVVAFLLSQRHQAFWKKQHHQRQMRHKCAESTQTQSSSNAVSSSSSVMVNSDDNSLLFSTTALIHGPLNPDMLTSPANGHIQFIGHAPTIQFNLAKVSLPCSCCLHTLAGRVPFSQLVPADTQFLRSPDVERGSIVAIYYELEPISSDLFCLTNGQSDTLVNGSLSDAVHSFVQLIGESITNAFASETHSQRTDPEHFSSSSLFFILKFHVVINGIDLIAAMKPIAIRPTDLLYSNDSDHSHVHLETPNKSNITHKEHFAFSHPVNPIPSSALLRIRAVFDVYGQTKAIQLLSLSQKPIPLLSQLCSCTILNQVLSVCDSKMDELNKLKSESLSPLKSSNMIRLSRAGQASLHPMNNLLLRQMISILDSLPLPRTERVKLQRDAYAIAARRLSD